jgi:hypothetical protein
MTTDPGLTPCTGSRNIVNKALRGAAGKRYWGQQMSARGYFCATVGAVDEATIKARAQRSLSRRQSLLLQDLLYLPKFLLDFAGQLFVLTFNLQVRLMYDLAYLFLHCAFRFVNGAFDLIVCTRFHIFAPCRIFFCYIFGTRQLRPHSTLSW